MFAQIPKAESDPIFALNAAYKADTNPKKVNLGIGAYRTNEGVPWVLPSVQKAEQKILDMKLDHEYLPIEGLQRFTDSAARLMLGSFAAEGKHAAVQSISGTGGVRYGAELLNRFPPKAGKVVYISKPTWGNHKNIFQDAGFEVKEYKYWNASTNGLDLAGMLNDIKSAPEGSVILLHACAHNPTGVDPTEDQWNQILSVIRDKNHLTFFDSAYQGFASGNVDKDAFSVRLWCKEQIPFVLAMSFSKNFGLYNERCGVTIVYCPGANGKIEAENIRSQLARIARPMISNPPAHGARIVDIVLNSDELHKEWLDNIKTMSERIIKMRKALFDVLVQKQTPGTWNHITDQIGMFSYTGLTKEQCKCLIEKFHIYLVDNGRISMAGINEGNVEYVGNAIDYAVRTYPSKL